MKIEKSISFVIEVLVDKVQDIVVLRAPNGQPLAFIDEYSEIGNYVSSYLYPSQDKENQ